MNNTSIAVSLDTRQPKKDGTFPLIFRLTHFRKTLPISIGISLQKEDWDEDNRVVKKSYVGNNTGTRINNSIAKKRAAFLDVLLKLDEAGKLNQLSIHEVREHLVPKQASNSFFEFSKAQVAELKSAKRIGTAHTYHDAAQAVRKFHKGKDLLFREITPRFLEQFAANHRAKGNGANGLAAYMRTIRALYNKAIKAGAAEKEAYPFSDYKITTVPTIKRALDSPLLKKIIEANLEQTDPLFKTRNYFLASYMMYGMNFCDMACLQKADIGDGRIDYRRSKTKKVYNIKITDSLQKVLEYFAQFTEGTPYVFPIIKRNTAADQDKDIKWSRKRYNKKLKLLAQQCGIEKNLTSYVSRHSFATHASYADIPVTAISTMLGHSSIKTTQIYLQSLPLRTIDEYNALLVNAL